MTKQQYQRFTEEPTTNDKRKVYWSGFFMAAGFLTAIMVCMVLIILAMIGVIL